MTSAAGVRRTADHRRESTAGWLFVTPAAIHLAVFVVIPIVFTVFLSVHKWDVLKPSRPFTGMANYRVLFRDALFWNAMRNSAVYALASVPLGMLLAMGVAILVNQPLRGVKLFRTLFYTPAVSSSVALSMVWMFLYLPEHGIFAWIAGRAGLPGVAQIDWLQSPKWAMAAIVFMSLWTGLGPRMVLYLSGLAAIPPTVYEAAAIDGATGFASFRHVTLPLLLPTTVFILVTSSIGAFQVFTPIYMMTHGGPVRRTDVVGYHIYQEAWRQFHMGMAAAQSCILFAVIFAVTAAQFVLINRRMTEYSLQ